MAKLVFLGRLEDVAGEAEREISAGVLEEIVAALAPDLAGALKGPRIRVAVNGTLIAHWQSCLVRDDDEIAFLPPVSGG